MVERRHFESVGWGLPSDAAIPRSMLTGGLHCHNSVLRWNCSRRGCPLSATSGALGRPRGPALIFVPLCSRRAFVRVAVVTVLSDFSGGGAPRYGGAESTRSASSGCSSWHVWECAAVITSNCAGSHPPQPSRARSSARPGERAFSCRREVPAGGNFGTRVPN
jgi:hypothetical protein